MGASSKEQSAHLGGMKVISFLGLNVSDLKLDSAETLRAALTQYTFGPKMLGL